MARQRFWLVWRCLACDRIVAKDRRAGLRDGQEHKRKAQCPWGCGWTEQEGRVVG